MLKRLTRGRLSYTVPLGLVGVVVLTFAVALALSLTIGRESLLRRVQAEAEGKAFSYAATAQAYVEGARSVIGSTAELPAFNSANPAVARAALAALHRNVTAFEHVLWLAADGTPIEIAPSAGKATLPSGGFAYARWYAAALKSTGPVISDLEVSPLTGAPAIFIAAPVRAADGRLAGVIVGTLHLSDLSRVGTAQLSTEARERAGYGFLTDHRGLVIAHQLRPRFVEVQTDFSSLPSVREALANRVGAGEIEDPVERSRMLAAWLPLQATGWAVVYQTPTEAALAPLDALTRSLLWSTLAGVALLGTLSVLLAARITRPIRSLTDVVTGMSIDGEHRPQPIALGPAPAEVQRLAESFDKLAAELHEKYQSLREAHRAKDEFLGMLSHELRNPLAPIRNSTYILRHAEPGSEQARRAQAAIERQSEHLTRLVDDLLDVTRIARGKIQLRRSRVDLRDLVCHVAEDFRFVMRDRGVRFDVVAPEEQLWVDADATRITQVVGNLLHNAAKFTRAGDQVRVTLEDHDRMATIRVTDTGAGIDSELLPKVFDAFVQGHRTLARTDGGLGLGLALVKGVTELHGGTVRADSAGKGKGSEFVLTLPLAASPVVEPRPAPRSEQQNGARRVVVVDDNRDAAESLADLVRMLGHGADVAYDGPTAIEMVRADPPDVVLCDIGLPGMSGYEVAHALRASHAKGTKLIAMSGYAQPEDVKRAIEAGFDDHVAKPCDPDQIRRLLS